MLIVQRPFSASSVIRLYLTDLHPFDTPMQDHSKRFLSHKQYCPVLIRVSTTRIREAQLTENSMQDFHSPESDLDAR